MRRLVLIGSLCLSGCAGVDSPGPDGVLGDLAGQIVGNLVDDGMHKAKYWGSGISPKADREAGITNNPSLP